MVKERALCQEWININIGSDYISGIKCGIRRHVLCNRITAPWCRGSRLSVQFPLFQQLLTSFVMLMSLQFIFVFVICCFSLCSYLCHFVTSSVCLGFSVMFVSVFLRLCMVFFVLLYFIFASAGLVWTGSLNLGPKSAFCWHWNLVNWCTGVSEDWALKQYSF